MSRRRRRIVAVLALCVAASMALGVGSYSSVSADRNVTVAVVADEDAYLAFGEELQCGMGNGHGDNQQFIRNQFPENTTIEHIEVEVGVPRGANGALRVRKGERGNSGGFVSLSEGRSTTFTYEASYGAGEAARIQVVPPARNVSGANRLAVELIEADGTDVKVTGTSTTYDVNCPRGGSSGGNGGGNGPGNGAGNH